MAIPRIFVSHSSHDDNFGVRLVQDLRSALGSDDAVWYDSWGGLEVGSFWWAEIVREVSAREIFLLVLSPEAMASYWVLKELDMAITQRKRIIPLLYRDCKVRADLQMIQMIRFLPPKTYEVAFAELQAALGLPAETEGKKAPIHVPLSQRASVQRVPQQEAPHYPPLTPNVGKLSPPHSTQPVVSSSFAKTLKRTRSLSIIAAVSLMVLLVVVAVAVVPNFLTSAPRASVINLNDSGPGSLRQAILDASPGSTITFAGNLKGTIILTSGELEITKNLFIKGLGPSVLSISGNFKSRIFLIDSNVTTTVSDLSIINGNVHTDRGTVDSGGGINNQGVLAIDTCMIFGNQTARDGGGVENNGTLTVIHSAIFDNNAFGVGGGIHTGGTNATINSSTVSDNIAGANGGGIDSGTTLSLNNSTVSGNIAAGTGGGVNAGGGAGVLILSSTIYNNTARSGGNIFDMNTDHPIIKLQHSIVAAGHDSSYYPELEGYSPDIGGFVLMSGDGYNLIQDTSGAYIKLDSTHPIDLLNVDPHLGPLKNNSGPTQTHALLTGSPAIDAIPCGSTTSLRDQRGIKRPDDNEDRCDIGAYES